MDQHPLAAAILQSSSTIAIVGDRQLGVAALTELLLKYSDFRLIARVRGTDRVETALEMHRPAVIVEARNGADALPLPLGHAAIASMSLAKDGPGGFASSVRAAMRASAENRSTNPSDQLLLSEREREILTLVASGHSVKEVARRYAITPKTVGNHLGRICEKLHLRGRGQLVLFAIQHGLTTA